jgi:LysM repeat protein
VNQDKNEAAQEFMEEIVDDLGYTPKGGRNQRSVSTVDPSPVPKFLIPCGIGIVLLIAVIAFFLAGRRGDNAEELAAIEAGMKRLEERMADLATLEQRMSRLEGLKGLKGLGAIEDKVIRLEREAKRLEQEIDKIAAREVTSAPKQAAPEVKQVASAPKQPAPVVKQRYHTVRSGESLYSIAKKYGISTEKLCQLNKITPKKAIRPGQKLLVGE